MIEKTQGRVLRVKQGYNPNSSSMGSIIYAFPAAMLVVTAGFGAVAGVVTAAFVKERRGNDAHKDDTAGPSQSGVAESVSAPSE